MTLTVLSSVLIGVIWYSTEILRKYGELNFRILWTELARWWFVKHIEWTSASCHSSKWTVYHHTVIQSAVHCLCPGGLVLWKQLKQEDFDIWKHSPTHPLDFENQALICVFELRVSQQHVWLGLIGEVAWSVATLCPLLHQRHRQKSVTVESKLSMSTCKHWLEPFS